MTDASRRAVLLCGRLGHLGASPYLRTGPLRGEILGVEASVQQSVNHQFQRNTANGMELFCQIEICAMKLTGPNPIDGRTTGIT